VFPRIQHFVSLWVTSVPSSRHFFLLSHLWRHLILPHLLTFAASSPLKAPIKGSPASHCPWTGHSWWFRAGFPPVLCPSVSDAGEDSHAAAAQRGHPPQEPLPWGCPCHAAQFWGVEVACPSSGGLFCGHIACQIPKRAVLLLLPSCI